MAIINNTNVLGFTGKFYAIWTVKVETYSPFADCEKTVTRYIYGRKVSKYLDKALKKYPGIEVLDILENKTRSFSEWETNYTGVTTFRFGKYKGQLINNCTDIDYLYWYYKTTEDSNQKRYIKNILVNHGYVAEVKRFKSGLFIREEVTLTTPKQIQAKGELAMIIKRLENQKVMHVKITKYPNSDGIFETPSISYKFPEVIAHYYEGYAYYMPTINGKSKRVKGKIIEITKCTYSIDNDFHITINILEWKIKK